MPLVAKIKVDPWTLEPSPEMQGTSEEPVAAQRLCVEITPHAWRAQVRGGWAMKLWHARPRGLLGLWHSRVANLVLALV